MVNENSFQAKETKNCARPRSTSTIGERLRFSVASSFADEKMLQHFRLQNQCSDQQLLERKPSSVVGKVRFYYGRYKLRYFTPYVMLIFYSVFGALYFYFLESDNERRLFRDRELALGILREETYQKIRNSRNSTSKDVFERYDAELKRILGRSDDLEWDLWGAFYYVGTIYTTIGYGNIYPRTVFGKLSTVFYALIGIPLVLAILSQSGQALSNLVSSLWLRYRLYIKEVAKKRQFPKKNGLLKVWRLSGKRKEELGNVMEAEEGRINVRNGALKSHRKNAYKLENEEEEHVESRTIPIWGALFICFAWICTCAGIFCIWETWSYYDSLYFFFVSLSTIGLGDVVPEHPHILIVLFIFVIVGLSLVSMLLSILQIKIEEFLYQLALRMRKEYQEALERGDPVERDAIIQKILNKQPWFLRTVAPHLLSNKQAAEIQQQADSIERCVLPSNTKTVQTDGLMEEEDEEITSTKLLPTGRSFASKGVTTDYDSYKTTLEAMSSTAGDTSKATTFKTANSGQWKAGIVERSMGANVYESEDEDTNSVSDITSLPVDVVSEQPELSVSPMTEEIAVQSSAFSLMDRSQQIDVPVATDQLVQTDISEFQLDEIKLKLLNLQMLTKPEKKTQAVETISNQPSLKWDRKDEAVQYHYIPLRTDQEATTEGHETASEGTGTDFTSFQTLKDAEVHALPSLRDESVITDVSNQNFVNTGIGGEEVEYLEKTTETDNEAKSFADKSETANFFPSISTSTSNSTATPASEKKDKSSGPSGLMLSSFNSVKKLRLRHYGVQCLLWLENRSNVSTQTTTEKQKNKPQQHKARKAKPHSFLASNEDAPLRIMKDLIVQTDDSYLKIARRLDEIRSKHTGSLPVYAAKPLLLTSPRPSTSKQPDRVPSDEEFSEKDPSHPSQSKRRKSLLQRVDEFLSTKTLRTVRHNDEQRRQKVVKKSLTHDLDEESPLVNQPVICKIKEPSSKQKVLLKPADFIVHPPTDRVCSTLAFVKPEHGQQLHGRFASVSPNVSRGLVGEFVKRLEKEARNFT